MTEQRQDDMQASQIVGESKVVRIGCVHENDWNPNQQDERTFHAEKESISTFGYLDDILVRPHPEIEGEYQIIDGAHRSRAAAELGFKEIGVRVVDVDEPTAKKLTIVMNETKGKADKVDLAKLLADLEVEFGEDLGVGLPYAESELAELVSLAGHQWDDYEGGEYDPDEAMGEGSGAGSFETFEVTMTEEDFEAFEEARSLIDEAQALTGGEEVRKGQVIAALCAEYLAVTERASEKGEM